MRRGTPMVTLALRVTSVVLLQGTEETEERLQALVSAR